MTAAASLRRRLLAWLLAATAVIGALALADTWREARATAQVVSDRVLAGSALAIAERVTVDEGGGLAVDIPYSALEMLTSSAQDQVFYRVDGPGGAFLTGYDSLPPVTALRDGLGFADGSFRNVPLRIATLSRAVSAGSGSIPFTVTVAESTLARDALARAILLRSALRLATMILGAAAIAGIVVTLALRPLDRLGEAIAERSPDDLSPISTPVPQEVAGVVSAVNSFMGRLDGALAALRHFTGNASHQLRTPLATLRTQLALARRAKDPAEAEAAAAKAEAALVRAERVLAQLLVLARVDAAAASPADATADIAGIARDMTAEMVPAASARGIDLGYEGPAHAFARGEAVLVAEMLRNLIDNAIAYAGAGADVTVRVVAGDAGVLLSVADSGPGLPPDRLAALQAESAAPAPRGAPRPVAGREGEGGYGLGLAILREIAALFGAECRFAQGDGGRGLVVTCRFRAVG
jgi:two-component system sensor histidine kinase TctE